MDVGMLLTKLEAAVDRQVLVAGGQPEVEAAAAALIEVLGPALREVALDLAGQAAAEVAAQLPDHEVEVVLADGDPNIKVGRREDAEVSGNEPLDARITLRLSPKLKSMIETAADERGESVNAWLVRSLSGSTSSRKRSRGGRITGRIET
jgi:hypothetical protein